jgi:predicted phage terminase large subunit-like protein
MTEPTNGNIIDGFTRGMLAAKYDNPKPIPAFHREMWDLCYSDAPKVAIAAPRGHAKSTAITHAFILAMVCFRIKSFVLLVSDTEGQAAEFLGDIKAELNSNDLMRETFGIKSIVKDTETNIVCRCKDGEYFRIVAKGSMQKVRGLKWRGKRPDLIVGDDLENDDIVMNPERREKFRRWFMNALVPCGSDTCWIRIVGTILHLDSALQRLLDDPTWKTLFYEAHNHDFSEILWAQQYSKTRLLAIRAGYEAQNDLDGYSQEYLNRPVATGNAYLNPDYFYDFERDKNDKWIKPNLEYYAAADFAISEKERADYTVIGVAGIDPEGTCYLVSINKFRGDADRIIEELLATQKHYKPNVFTFETEKIDKAIGPSLRRAMQRARIYLNINLITPVKSKTTRGKSIQAMHKSGAMRYDLKAEWFPDFYSEMQTITDSGPRGKHDDSFDVLAYIGLTIDAYYEAYSDKEIEEEEYDNFFDDYADQGRCASTGY